MIGVGVLPVRCEDDARPQLAQGAGQAVPGRQVRHKRAVGEAEVAAPVQSEDGGGGVGLAAADFGAAVWRRLAVGQVEYADPTALRFEQQDGATGAEFGVVWVRRDDEVVKVGHGYTSLRFDLSFREMLGQGGELGGRLLRGAG